MNPVRSLRDVGSTHYFHVDVCSGRPYSGMEARDWNNDGITEDVATGSGAGCAAAYLRRHGRIDDGAAVVLRQGRFTGRPSEMLISVHGRGETSAP
ncbi:PhzF family phenazine biosynthesis protein [Streptomyces sp. NPDC093795]|uniref:PhzF family phenazine biosynthesis protein n=1 Tax=Streptomyces sp. NPDC093795 TaxID=3366051 RepID=UPI00381DB993